MEGLDLFQIFSTVLGNNSIVGAISSSLLIILLGFFLTKKEIFDAKIAKQLSLIILTVALPALSFKSFMQDISPEKLMQGATVLIWGFVIQGSLIFLMKIYYFRYEEQRKKALTVLTTLGSTTFFGMPIIGAIYGTDGILYASLFNISYRIFLYSWGFISFSGLKMTANNIKQMVLNPIIIATFLGLFIWIFQDFLPQVHVGDKTYAFLRLDKTAYWLFKPMEYLAVLASPLAWLSIGATLGQVSLGSALTNKTAWLYTFTKILLVPTLSTVGLFVANIFFPIPFISVAVSAIMMATPPATVAVAYSIKFDNEAITSSNCSLISPAAAVFIIPFIILILEIIKNFSMFM